MRFLGPTGVAGVVRPMASFALLLSGFQISACVSKGDTNIGSRQRQMAEPDDDGSAGSGGGGGAAADDDTMNPEPAGEPEPEAAAEPEVPAEPEMAEPTVEPDVPAEPAVEPEMPPEPGAEPEPVPEPTDVPTEIERRPRRIAPGSYHTCALDGGGAVCWGDNSEGQLGTGDTEPAVLPNDPVGGANPAFTSAVEITSGGTHSCAVLSSGAVRCWGRGDEGQLGNDGEDDSSLPVQVAVLDDAVSIVAGGRHSCALRGDASVWCWGGNDRGQLGTGDTDASEVPVPVVGLDDEEVVILSAGEASTCVVTASADAYCWGANDYGQLGTGAASAEPTPAPQHVVNGVGNVMHVAIGATHACAVTTAGAVKCWGNGSSGASGVTTSDGTAAQVEGIADAVEVAVGAAHSCALRGNGMVQCWGASPQIGGGNVAAAGAAPVTVTIDSGGDDELAGVVQIAAGGNAYGQHTCALLEDDTAWCWGDGALGKLGSGSSSPRTYAAEVQNYPGD